MNFTIRSAGMVDIAGFISEHLAVDIPVVVSSLFTLDLRPVILEERRYGTEEVGRSSPEYTLWHHRRKQYKEHVLSHGTSVSWVRQA